MTALEQDCADALAFALADMMCQQIPSLFGDPPEAVVSITLPIACTLIRAESKAARSKKHARKYRQVRRDVRELLRTQPETPVRPGLGQTVPFDPEAWHLALLPGYGHDGLAVTHGQA